ncbi:MAG: class I SAM-dependent methyltransferase [Bacteroidota bacterium]
MNIQPASRNLIDSIPSSNTDALLRERGFDLLYEYLQIINEARFPPGRIIELATGTGRTSAIFARQGFEVVTGDITLTKRGEALRRISPESAKQVSMMVLNMERLPFRDHSVPAVISLNTIHELKHPDQCLSEIVRIHDPAGVLVVGDFNKLGFEVMDEVHQIVFGKRHSRGRLPMESVKEKLTDLYESVVTIETPLNISVVCRTAVSAFS